MLHEFVTNEFPAKLEENQQDLCDFLFDELVEEPSNNQLIFSRIRISDSYQSVDMQEGFGVGSRSSQSPMFENQLIPEVAEQIQIERLQHPVADDVEMDSIHTLG